MSATRTLPSDWTIASLDYVSAKVQDGTHFSPKLGGSEFKYITSKNIGAGKLRLDSVATISHEEHAKIYRRCEVRYGDLLLTKDGANTGNVAINSFAEEISLLSSVAFIRANPRRSVESYILQYLLSAVGRRQVEDAMAGNAITRLTLAKIKDLRIPLPPLSEQQKIGEALHEADDLIATLERLIAKKQAINRGMMQQLLSGAARLPGFTEPWIDTRLGAVSHIKTGSRNNQDKTSFGRYPFFVRSATVERIDSFSYDCEAILIPGEGGIGSIFHYIKGKFEVHQRVYRISDFAADVSGRFIYFYMRQYFGAHAMENSVKATVDSLRLPTFNGFGLHIPAQLGEQRAIATLLDDAEREIDVLRHRLVKATSVKTGMMQQLLSGRTRLPVAEAAS